MEGMKTLIRYKHHLIAAAVLMGLFLVSARTVKSSPVPTAADLPVIKVKSSLGHSKELLPKRMRAALGRQGNPADLREFILNQVTLSLPKKQQGMAFDITRAVITEANYHNMDPMFLLAVIETESRYNNNARGAHGEIGLMQVLPKTAEWLQEDARLPSDFDLRDPAVNIRIGATYLAKLRYNFKGHGRRYVAAYNMGPRNVRRLLADNTEPRIYPDKVLGNYRKLYTQLTAVTVMGLSRNLAAIK
jgi:soluble lytic murein transglycosylase